MCQTIYLPIGRCITVNAQSAELDIMHLRELASDV